MQRYMNPNPNRASRSKEQFDSAAVAEIAGEIVAAATPVVPMPPLVLAPAPAAPLLMW